MSKEIFTNKAPTALRILFLSLSFFFLTYLNLILAQQFNHGVWNSYTDIFRRKKIKYNGKKKTSMTKTKFERKFYNTQWLKSGLFANT